MPHFVFVVRPGGTRSLGMFVGRILGVFAVFPPSVYLELITQGVVCLGILAPLCLGMLYFVSQVCTLTLEGGCLLPEESIGYLGSRLSGDFLVRVLDL